jgi:4'-phosphopantetheinyl transferase
VDVEKVRPEVECVEIARRFFSEREIEAFFALPANKRRQAFFACWTRKEAFLKSTGHGLTYPLSEFSVSVDPDGPAELWEVKGDPNAVAHWFLESIRLGAAYMGALAYKGPACRANFTSVETGWPAVIWPSQK